MQTSLIATCWIVGLLAAAAGRAPAAEPANYARPFEPPTRRALIPLPPGTVEPGGWLRDWCLAAKNGYTGHMDDVDIAFQQAWAADYNMTGNRLNWPQGAWPYEGGGYWFDGLARLGFVLHDDELLAQAKRRLGVLLDHSNPNGILFLWWLDRNNPADMESIKCDHGWPIWACGLLGRAMAAYYDGSRDPRVLKTLETAYSGNRELALRGWSLSNPWPAYETYTWTGNKDIAATLTMLFSADAGGANTLDWSWDRYRRMPNPAPGAEQNDHVVHFLEATTPWALGYLWTGDRKYLETTLAWQGMVERDSMQPSGVPVADEFYGPTGAFRATETCDVAGYLWSQVFLLAIAGDGRMADRAERAMFNAGPATVSRDFKTHVYFQSPNRVADGSPPCPHGPQASGGSYRLKHSPLCCTAALNRVVPNYVMHMWMATYDNGLAATLYGPCKVTALVADRVPVTIECRTDYPFNEHIEMAVRPAKEAAFPLSLRIPGWCGSPGLKLNGEALPATPDANGFVRIMRRWKAGDSIQLHFPMIARITGGRDANADGAPYAAVSCGPLLMALPIADTDGPNTPDPAAVWRYAVDWHDGKAEVERGPMPPQWDWPLDAPLKLRIPAVAIDWNPAPEAPRLPAQPAADGKPAAQVTLVPFGCTKFRVSMFPVTERAWKALEAQRN